MKKIIIVDDDRIGLNFLAKQFRAKTQDIDVLTAENGKDAIGLLQKEKIDLVLTDLKMPVLDGFELMAYMGREYPDVTIFVMTSFGAPAVKAKVDAIGPSRYYEKPVNLEHLMASVTEELEAGVEGRIFGIALISFVQLINMDRKTCTLNIRANGRKGTLYFFKGELISADTEELKNLDAVYEILKWEKPDIEIENVTPKKENEINRPLISILMDTVKAEA